MWPGLQTRFLWSEATAFFHEVLSTFSSDYNHRSSHEDDTGYDDNSDPERLTNQLTVESLGRARCGHHRTCIACHVKQVLSGCLTTAHQLHTSQQEPIKYTKDNKSVHILGAIISLFLLYYGGHASLKGHSHERTPLD